VFGRTKNGQVRFHKDGYTDLRGKFDYLQLSDEKSINDLDKFAFFIMSDELGNFLLSIIKVQL